MKTIQKSTHPKLSDVKKDEHWFVLDAEGKVLGQVATRLAMVLRGKHKPLWHPSLNCGDHVVVINAEKVVLTGKKEWNKTYYRHTGYPGSVIVETPEKLRQKHPERIIEWAVSGMIPRNRLRQHALAKLHVYKGTEHPHGPQNPQTLTL